MNGIIQNDLRVQLRRVLPLLWLCLLAVAQTGFASYVTRYQYDEAGNQVAQVDALGRTNTFAYDGLGRRILHTLPGNQTEGFAYDLGGNLVYETNFNGMVITNQYDVLNRLSQRSAVNGYSVSYVYTATGQRQIMTDASGVTSYGYDSRDRLTNKVVSLTGGPILTLNYGYDANGSVTNLASTTPGGVSLAYRYDPLSRLTNVLSGGSAAASYAFDAVGNLQAVNYGNGVTNLYQYDALNRLTNLTWKLTTSTLASFYYQLGLTGNRTNLAENVSGFKRTNAWSYDGLYRLTNESIGTNGGSGALAYTYDAVGNRQSRTVTGSNLVLTNQTPTYTTNDWLVGDVYDNNGNTRTNGSSQPYFYDAENRLTNFNNGAVIVGYNGDGIRVSKTVGGTTTYYLVDDRNPSGYAQVVEEWTSTGGGTPALNRVYSYGLDLISQNTGGTIYYFGYDGHGSTRELLTTSGTVQEAYAYDAFGTLIAGPTTPATSYLYCGEQFDKDLGFYYLRARYLNPNTDRFWTMDTYQCSQEEPLSLHKYSYGADNPVNLKDPSGREFTAGELMVVGGIVGALQGVVTTAISAGKHTAGQYLANAFSGGIIGAGTAGIGTWFWEMGAAGRILLGGFGAAAGIANTEIALQNGDTTLAKYHLVTTVVATGLFISGDVLISRINRGRTPRYTPADVEAAISRLQAKGIHPSEFQSHLDPDNAIALAELMNSGGFDPALMSDPVIFETSSRSYLSGHHRIIAAEMAGKQLPQHNLEVPGTQAGDWSQVQRLPGRRLFGDQPQ